MKLNVFLLYFCVASSAGFRNHRHGTRYRPHKYSNALNSCSSVRPHNPQSGCCGIDVTGTSYIVGGSTTLIQKYPWLALLEYHNRNHIQTSCGGFLISSRYVLTAAHCIMPGPAPQSVRLGEYDTSNRIDQHDCVLVNRRRQCTNGAMRVRIQHIVVHINYNKHNSHNDIALVRLESMVEFTEYIRPICLPTFDITTRVPRYHNFYASGWGAIYQNMTNSGYANHVDPIKRHAPLSHVPNQVCRRSWGVWDNQICAGGEGVSTCSGDSGGPLMSKNGSIYEAVGIVSYGPEICNDWGVPSVYTKVFAYRDWIDDNIEYLE